MDQHSYNNIQSNLLFHWNVSKCVDVFENIDLCSFMTSKSDTQITYSILQSLVTREYKWVDAWCEEIAILVQKTEGKLALKVECVGK